jgi:hypothetical protein
MTMPKDLQAAAALIERYLNTLNGTEKSTCSCCGVAKYENFDNYRRHLELTAMVNKLRRLK